MFVIARYKDTKPDVDKFFWFKKAMLEISQHESEIAVDKTISGIAVQQWYVDTEEGKKLRFFIVVPNFESQTCEVECIIEEENDWKELGKTGGFAKSAIDLGRLPELTEEVETDLYYVWDDGAGKHPERARRLFETFKKEIVAFKGLESPS